MSSAENPDRFHGHSLPALVEIMHRLLGPDGCPWDREQTIETLMPFLVEETYEVIDAVETGSPAEHCEELGDLLMQIVFQAALRQAEGAFDIDDVIRGIADKLVRRHPHVFADSDVATSAEVLVQWEEIKAEEKRARGQKSDQPASGATASAREDAGPPRTLAGVPAAMPALPRAQKLSSRAARIGFDWPDSGGCMDKVREELAEIEEAVDIGDPDHIEAEVGDLLFAAVSLARKLGCDAESALRRANRRFAERFHHVEDGLHERGRSPKESSIEEMEALWREAKAKTRG